MNLRCYPLQQKRAATLIACGLIVFVVTASCRSSSSTNQNTSPPSGIVVLNAPASGIVRRVMVGEGMRVSEGAAVIEIAVPAVGVPATSNANAADPRESVQAARQQRAAIEREVERAAVEVQRMETLVAGGSAPQPQLDAARAEYQRAQERLQQQQQRAGAPIAPSRASSSSSSSANARAANPNLASGETIVPLRATSSGTVRVISVRAGQPVTISQPLATLSATEK